MVRQGAGMGSNLYKLTFGLFMQIAKSNNMFVLIRDKSHEFHVIHVRKYALN